MNKLLTVEDLSFRYKDQDALLENISFDFKPGEILTFLGQNGSGKTTLLNLVLGFLKHGSGDIKWYLPQDKLAFVKQFANMNFNFPMSVHEFLALAFLKDHSVFYRLSYVEQKKIEKIFKF